jgi:hypothetical protein
VGQEEESEFDSRDNGFYRGVQWKALKAEDSD